jgi:hypothetical protein
LTVVAELPDLRSDRLPARPPPPAPLFDQPPAFGVARDLELMKQGALAPRVRRPQRRSRFAGRHDGGTGGGGRRSRDSSRLADVWHRLRCRTGHHDFRGGHQLQLGSRFVYVERRCQWCDASPF